MASAEEDYKCSLDETSQKKARDELNEKVLDRAEAVIALRSWVKQQPWLRTPTDFSFLLRFLRVRKYSQLAARDTLINFWMNRTRSPDWFANVDPADPLIQTILRTGTCYASTKRSRDGRRFIFACDGKLESRAMKQWGVANVYKAKMLVCDWVNRDEAAQVNGIEVLIDDSDMTAQHSLILWNLDTAKRALSYYQNSLPTRTKHMHLYNEPHFFDALWALITPFVKEKTRARFHLYGQNLAKVYQVIDKSMLPDDYLPDDYTGPSAGAVDDIVEAMIADMMKPEFRNYIKELSSSKYGVDLVKKPKKDTPVGSFRKLSID